MDNRTENPILAHRPKKRRNYVADPKSDQKSQNLKLLHQTLLCDQSSKNKPTPP